MKDIAVPFRQLVERRLWPLAALLLAALVAIPVVLAKSPSAPAPAAGPVASASSQGATEPIVSLSQPESREAVRKVLGSRKNPFRPAIKGHAARKVAAPTVSSAPAAPSHGLTGGGASGPLTVGAPSVPVITAPATPKKTYELYSLKVNFGDSAAEQLTSRTIKRLTALPSNEDAAVIYLGLLKDHRTAVFLVDGAAKVQGDGKCLPSAADCQTLRLKRGDTAFIDMPSETGTGSVQYQLDLVKVRTKKTTNAHAAKRSYVSVAKGGRNALRARLSRANGVRYDARAGVIKPASSK
jgi:hypothetical protein